MKRDKKVFEFNVTTLIYSMGITVQTLNFADTLFQWFITGLQQLGGGWAK